MGSARTAEAGSSSGGGGGGDCRRRYLKKAAAAASDGSEGALGHRRQLPSFLGTARVLKRKGSVRGPAASSRGAGRVFVWLRSAPGSRSEQLQLQQQRTFPQPSETRAAASVLLFRHLPGAREPAGPPCPRCLSPLSLSATSLPGEGGAESSQERGRGWKETGCSGLRPPSQVQHQEPGGVATSAGRLPPWPWGTGFKAWEKFLHFEEGPLAGCCRWSGRGAASALVPALVSSTFAIRCLLRSCGVSGRREGLTRAHTGLPFSRLQGSQSSSCSHRLTATSSFPRTPRQDPRRGHLHLAFALLPCLPASPDSILGGALVLNLASWISSVGEVTSGYCCRLPRPHCPFVFSP